jgi:hypothetical protein
MKLVKTLSHLGGLDILVFYCSRCKQAETKVQERGQRRSLKKLAASIRTIQGRCFRGSLSMR